MKADKQQTSLSDKLKRFYSVAIPFLGRNIKFIVGMIAIGFLCCAIRSPYGWSKFTLFFLCFILVGVLLYLILNRKIGSFDRTISGGFWKQIGVLSLIGGFILFACVVLVLSLDMEFNDVKPGTNLYERIIAVTHRFMGYNYYKDSTVINYILLFVSVLGTLIVSGLLISTFSNIVQQRKKDVEEGLAKYKKAKNHSIVIGYGSYSPNLIRHLLSKTEDAIVLLMTNKEVVKVRSDLRAQLSENQIKRLFIIAGDMACEEDIRTRLTIEKAKEVYILGEVREFGVDSKNVECANFVNRARKEAKCEKIIPVYVHLHHQQSYKYISSLDNKSENSYIFLRPFSFYENWARLLWGYNALRIKEKNGEEKRRYDPLNFEPITENKHVHLVVVGLNRMGIALVVQALRICHFPNFDAYKKKTQISIIEKDTAKIEEFQSLYPNLDKIEDIDVRFEKQENGSYHTFESFRGGLTKLAKNEDKLLTIAICYRDPDEALSAALRLPEEVYYLKDKIEVQNEKGKNKVISNNMRTRVLIRQKYENGLGRMIDADKIRYKNFRIFGMLKEGFNLDLLDDTLAKLAKYNYEKFDTDTFRKTFNLFTGELEEYPTQSKKGLSEEEKEVEKKKKEEIKKEITEMEKAWLIDSEWGRMSNRYQVDMYDTYLNVLKDKGLFESYEDEINLQSIKKYIEENGNKRGNYYKLLKIKNLQNTDKEDDTPVKSISEIEHRRWVAERILGGWRKNEDDEKRLDQFFIHHSIIPFDKLPEISEIEQYKDIIVVRNVPMLCYLKNEIKKYKVTLTQKDLQSNEEKKL